MLPKSVAIAKKYLKFTGVYKNRISYGREIKEKEEEEKKEILSTIAEYTRIRVAHLFALLLRRTREKMRTRTV